MHGPIAYLAASMAAATTTATTPATSSSGRTATSTFIARAFTVVVLLGIGLGLPGELHRDLTAQDFLTAQLTDCLLGLRRCRDIDESISDRLVRARILGNRNGLAASHLSACILQTRLRKFPVKKRLCAKAYNTGIVAV